MCSLFIVSIIWTRSKHTGPGQACFTFVAFKEPRDFHSVEFEGAQKYHKQYSGVPNRRTGLNTRTGWKYIKKLINAQGLIIIIL